MKKVLTLTAVMFLTASNAFAYTDNIKGFEIKNKAPQATINTSDTYGYLEDFDYTADNFEELSQKDLKVSNANFITVFTKEEASNILQNDFSTAAFNEQFNKLQLLKRSDLSLATLPLTVAELTNYIQNNKINSISINELRFGKHNFNLAEVKPILSVDEIGNHKVITSTYLIKQADIPYIINTSFISANDKLFVLSSCKSGENPEKKQNDEPLNFTKSTFKELIKVKNAELTDFAEGNIKEAWDKHVKFIKGFKVLPESKIKKNEQFGYHDNLKNKKFILPDDWMYQEINIKDSQFKGHIIVALPQEVMYKLADNDEVYNTALNMLDDLSNTSFEDKVIDGQKSYKKALENSDIKDLAKHISSNLDGVLITTNIAYKKNNLKDLLINPEQSKILLDITLANLFDNISSINNDLFKLNNYSYLVDVTKKRASINLDFNMNLFKQNQYDAKLKFLYNNNKITALMYFDKEDEKLHKDIEQQINQWDF